MTRHVVTDSVGGANGAVLGDGFSWDGSSLVLTGGSGDTAAYVDHVLTRITVIGAAYLAAICLIPEYFIAGSGLPFQLGGTSLLIIVNVTIDTISQIQSHMLAHQYGDLIKKAKLKGGVARR